MNRRQFIRNVGMAAGLVSLPTIIPASALGKGGRPAPSDRVVMGFIGLGSMGFADLKYGFIGKPEVQVVAVCDVNKEGSNYAIFGGGETRGREPARRYVEQEYASQISSGTYKGCDGYVNFEDVLGRDDIDAVCIAVPDHWHAYLTVAAAKAGKDIYSEKPLARTIYEGQQMVKAVRQYERVFQTGSQQRSDQRFRRACELARNGYLGEIKEVYAQVGGVSKPCPLGEEPVPADFDFERWLGNAPKAPYHHERVSGKYNTDGGTWRSWSEYSAGHISDWGAHNFDIAQWGLGMDESGPVQIIPPNGNDVKELTFIYASGIPMIKAKGPHDGMVQFIGTEGWVGVNRENIWASDEKLLTMEMKPSDTHLYKSENHHQNFLDCIKSRERPIADVSIGQHSLNVCLLGEIALRLNRPLKWDPAKEQFENDQEATGMLKRPMREPWVV